MKTCTRTPALPYMAAALACALALPACVGERAVPTPRTIVDLSPAITPDLNLRRLGARALDFLAADGRVQTNAIFPGDPTMAYGLTSIDILSHTGSHIDAPARLLRGGEAPGRVDLDSLFGPANVIDLRWHNRHTPIQITDLELRPIDPGDVVILFLGYEIPASDEWPRFAPLSVQAARWLVGKRIRALATDAPAITRFDDIQTRLQRDLPAEEVWAEYLPFFQSQIPVIAGLTNLDAIVRESRVAFMGLPLALASGTGAPMRAVALVY